MNWVKKRKDYCPLCKKTLTTISHGEGVVDVASFLAGLMAAAGTRSADRDSVAREHDEEEENVEGFVDACANCRKEEYRYVNCNYCRIPMRMPGAGHTPSRYLTLTLPIPSYPNNHPLLSLIRPAGSVAGPLLAKY